MKIYENSDIDINSWKEFFHSNQFSTPFQSIEFYDFCNKVSGMQASVYAVFENERIISLCVVTFQKEKGVKGFFSRRAIIYGGPLVEIERADALEFLFKNVNKELKKKSIYTENRCLKDYSQYTNYFLKSDWDYLPYLNVQIDLKNKNLDKLLSEMKYNRKREISLTLKENSEYREAASKDEVLELYKILLALYSERVKVPIPGISYFEKIFESPIGKVFVVIHNNKIIGGSFCFFYPGISINTSYYCGIRDYHKKIFPTHLAVLAAMEFGIKNNIPVIDLMGAGNKNEEYGVRKYKTAFGGELVEHGRYRKINNSTLFNIGKIGLNLIQKIKA